MFNSPKIDLLPDLPHGRQNHKNQLTFTLFRDFAYIKKFFTCLILYFDTFYYKNFDNNLNIHYFNGALVQITNSNIISTSFMRTLKNLTKSLFILVITCFLSYFLAISLIGFIQHKSNSSEQNMIVNNTGDNYQIDQKDMDLLYSDQEMAYKNANIIPFQSSTFSKFFLVSDFSKTQFIITYFILGLLSLLFATRLNIETSIYEFFNKGEDGIVVFENNEMMFYHYFSSFTGKILKAIGVSFGLVAIFFYVF
jgi:hypothetical protein